MNAIALLINSLYLSGKLALLMNSIEIYSDECWGSDAY